MYNNFVSILSHFIFAFHARRVTGDGRFKYHVLGNMTKMVKNIKHFVGIKDSAKFLNRTFVSHAFPNRSKSN